MFTFTNRARRLGAAGALALAVLLPATAAFALPPVGDDPPVPPPTTTPKPPPPPTTTPPPPPGPTGGPRYKLEAISFTADDESGPDWPGSDEAVWVFTSKDGGGSSRTVSQRFGDVDSGETFNFTTAKCLVNNCTTGVRSPLALATQLVEEDFGNETTIRNNVRYGITAAHWIARAFGVDSSVLDTELENFFTDLFSDDLMGSSSLMWANWELAQALPYVGSTYTETIHLGEQGGDLPDWLDNPPDYTLRLRLTRMADAPPVAAP